MPNENILLDLNGKSRAGRLTWSETTEQLKRMVARTPEVVVRVSGGAKTDAHVKDHLDYITRHGELEAADDKDDTICGKFAVAGLHDSWDLDMSNGQGKYRQAFNLVLSMPSGTDPARLLKAAQNFARDQFGGRHRYAMVLHTQETDPHKKPPKHPHVHLIVKAEDRNGRRLNIRKVTLQIWRESFAEKLREQAIEANATKRYSRGVTQKSKSSAEYHITGRKEKSTALAKRFEEAGKELQLGDTALKPWELAMAARRRDAVRELAANAARLRQEGDVTLAASVDRLATMLPPLDTERHQMKRKIAQQVFSRQQAQEPARNRDADKER